MALLESLAKQMLILKDAIMADIINFLDECEAHGKDIHGLFRLHQF
jgi:seryl-tRNA synthetase